MEAKKPWRVTSVRGGLGGKGRGLRSGKQGCVTEAYNGGGGLGFFRSEKKEGNDLERKYHNDSNTQTGTEKDI